LLCISFSSSPSGLDRVFYCDSESSYGGSFSDKVPYMYEYILCTLRHKTEECFRFFLFRKLPQSPPFREIKRVSLCEKNFDFLILNLPSVCLPIAWKNLFSNQYSTFSILMAFIQKRIRLPCFLCAFSLAAWKFFNISQFVCTNSCSFW